MQVKTMLKTLLLSAGLVSLVACSTTRSNGNGAGDGSDVASVNADNGGAMASGVGDYSGDGFGSNGNAKSMQVGNQHYYFDFNKNDVHSMDMASIKVQANYLATHPQARVLVTGNTDERGSREYNVALGSRRANSVERILELDGVNSNQITMVSYGAEKPVALAHNEDAYAQNRRADLLYQTPITR